MATDLRAIAALTALSIGLNVSDEFMPVTRRRKPMGPPFPPAPPGPLTKRQKRRLRGKAKQARV